MINLIAKLQLDKKKIILATIVFVVILYIDFSFILKTQFNAIKNANPKIIQLKKDLKKLNDDLISLKTQTKFEIKTKRPAEKTIERIVREDRLPQLLEEIVKTANKREVKIMQIKPVKSVSGKQATDSTAYSSLLITLDILSGYHQLGKFINDLENMATFISVENLQIRPEANDYINQHVNLTLKTYVKK